jgi:hypothetical protein
VGVAVAVVGVAAVATVRGAGVDSGVVPMEERDRSVILDALDRHPRRTSVILCIIVGVGAFLPCSHQFQTKFAWPEKARWQCGT